MTITIITVQQDLDDRPSLAKQNQKQTSIQSQKITTNQVITPNDSPILCGFMPSQKVVKTTLKGDYKNLKDAWGAANAYLEENSLEKMETSKDFEVYRTDPSADPNPANWVTEIYIPIK